MGSVIDEVINKLPRKRRAKVEARVSEMMDIVAMEMDFTIEDRADEIVRRMQSNTDIWEIWCDAKEAQGMYLARRQFEQERGLSTAGSDYVADEVFECLSKRGAARPDCKRWIGDALAWSDCMAILGSDIRDIELVKRTDISKPQLLASPEQP